MSRYNMLIRSPVGELLLTEEQGSITGCQHLSETAGNVVNSSGSGLLNRAAQQLAEYFAGTRTAFELPLAWSGSDFQRQVWCGLQAIPYGQTWSYQQLAKLLGKPKSSRAVGRANGKNPLWIIVPCHRVVRSTGELGGYAGGLEMKNWLLTLEQQTLAQR